ASKLSKASKAYAANGIGAFVHDNVRSCPSPDVVSDAAPASSETGAEKTHTWCGFRRQTPNDSRNTCHLTAGCLPWKMLPSKNTPTISGPRKNHSSQFAQITNVANSGHWVLTDESDCKEPLRRPSHQS